MTRSTDQLLIEIEHYLERTSMSASSFGEAILNDRHLVRRLRDGGSVTLDTADAIRAFMADKNRQPKRRRRSRSGNAPAVAA